MTTFIRLKKSNFSMLFKTFKSKTNFHICIKSIKSILYCSTVNL